MRAGSDIDQQRRDAQGGTHVQTRSDHDVWMLTSLLLWLCTLPIVGLLILPWLGARVAIIVAAVLLVASVTACYAICTWHVVKTERDPRDE